MKLYSATLTTQPQNSLTGSRTTDTSQPNAQAAQQLKSAQQASQDSLIKNDGPVNAPRGEKFTVTDPSATVKTYFVLGDERNERIENVLNRVSEEQRQSLINTEMILDENFLALAESLDDTALGHLASSIDKMQTPATVHMAPNFGLATARLAKEFVADLTAMSSDTQLRVLERAAGYAEQVISRPTDSTYSASGTLPFAQPSPSANNLYNFVSAVHKTDEPDTMLDSLQPFTESQQDTLLLIFGADNQLGQDVVEGLAERSEQTTDSFLNYLGGLAEKARPGFEYGFNKPVGYEEPDQANIDYDNDMLWVVKDMLDTTMSFISDYQFSDEQLSAMTDKLSYMETTHQRSYLEITETGLETLVGDEAETLQLEDNPEIIETLDQLRENHQTREGIALSRMGDDTGDPKSRYAIKDDYESKRDQKNMIRLMVTDAWLNQDDISRSTELNTTFSELNAEQRDQLVQDVNQLNPASAPLALQDTEELNQQFSRFLTRTNTLAETDNPAALLQAEEQQPGEQTENFWQAAEFAGDQVDALVGVLLTSSEAVGAQLLDNLTSSAASVQAGETGALQARTELIETLSFFSEPHPEEEQLEYLQKIAR
ncbi:hypothetical protein [Aliamphritea hakodatensis]|uniref:hypothetical protein n=1 Tax=Aliamphritea hakodatensis TaxID=2895352 RepID=UPI0022FD8D67|nr:hypothetical protein [Aliamphritea hakodatensis]